MTILSVSDIRLEYGTDIILQKINFSINEGDRLGIVGVNGAGKSTLLRIIAGAIDPSGGQVFIAKGKTVGMLEQNAMLESDKTLTEEMESAFAECQRIEKRLAALHNLRQRTHGLFQRRFGVHPMMVKNIHIVEPHPL